MKRLKPILKYSILSLMLVSSIFLPTGALSEPGELNNAHFELSQLNPFAIDSANAQSFDKTKIDDTKKCNGFLWDAGCHIRQSFQKMIIGLLLAITIAF